MTVGYKFKQIANKLTSVYRKGYLLGLAQKDANLTHSAELPDKTNTVEYNLVQVANNMLTLYQTGYHQGLIAGGAIDTETIYAYAQLTIGHLTTKTNLVTNPGQVIGSVILVPQYGVNIAGLSRHGLLIEADCMIHSQSTANVDLWQSNMAATAIKSVSMLSSHSMRGAGRLLMAGLSSAIEIDAEAVATREFNARVLSAQIAIEPNVSQILTIPGSGVLTQANLNIPNTTITSRTVAGSRLLAYANIQTYNVLSAYGIDGLCTYANIDAQITTPKVNATSILANAHNLYISNVISSTTINASIQTKELARLLDLTKNLHDYDLNRLYSVGLK